MLSPTEDFTIQENQPLDPQDSLTSSLAELSDAQNQLEQVKKNLDTIFDAMAQNPSIFSQAATYWGDLALWQKIVGGVIISVPTLAAGIAVNIGALIAISGVTVSVYTATSLLLDDHNNCNTLVLKRLEEGIKSLADILAITIMALEAICHKFEKGIQQFMAENFKLKQNVSSLSTQVDSLTDEVEQLSKTTDELRVIKEGLELNTHTLKESVEQHEQLIQQSEHSLQVAQQKYLESQNELSEKVVELRFVRTSMEEEVAKAKSVNEFLSRTVSEMATHVVADGEQRKVLDEKMQTFITDVDKSFIDITDKICKADDEAKVIRDQLAKSTEDYRELLEVHQKLVLKLEQVEIDLRKQNEIQSKQNAIQKGLIAEQLLSQGLFANTAKGCSMPFTTKAIAVI